jgi:hypothetical protein
MNQIDFAAIQRHINYCSLNFNNPVRELDIYELEEINKVGDITIVKPFDNWKTEWPLSLSGLGIPNWKFLVYDALKGCPGLARFENLDGYQEDVDGVCIMIDSHLCEYKKLHNKEHPFLNEYNKILEFFDRFSCYMDFVVN